MLTNNLCQYKEGIPESFTIKHIPQRSKELKFYFDLPSRFCQEKKEYFIKI